MDLFDPVLDFEGELNASLRYGALDAANDSTALDYAVDAPNATFAFGLNASSNETKWVENEYNLPLWRELIWSFVFGSMVLVATGGNLIVIWIVMANRRMRTVTNIFLVNLSVADTMVSTLNVVFNFTYMLNLHWQFGLVYCKISQFVSILSICASVFTLMAISFDRYVAIMYPLRPRMGWKGTILIVVWIWVSSIFISMPNMLFYTTAALPIKDGGERIVCYGAWPDGDQGESHLEYAHTVILMVLTYIVPLLCMGYTYARIGMTLWGSRTIGEQTPRQMESIRSKRKVVKMMIVVVTIFAVCWLPYHVYFILSNVMPEIAFWSYIQETYLAIYWLAMSNSMYNPMIYCWLNSRFRNGFKKVFSGCCPFIQYEREPPDVTRIQTTRFSCSGSPETHHRVSYDGSVHISMRTYVSEGGGGNCGRSSHGPLRLCNGANLRRATNGANARNYGGTGTLGGSGGSPMSGSSYTTTSAKKNAKFPSVAYQYV
ncbi:tachykinin-like peptides receptor 99D isoform X1 [Penaeus chinensis]|uniref:tachykinin-like peptides receptor 99D isoform X1 n=1 Tax=Penaeus chinensis TaxID=139456 RepID=UPI001FB7648D|nr:tachykinin-like peptides receptor 99D isoform X1 [Penaeus chinensis]